MKIKITTSNEEKGKKHREFIGDYSFSEGLSKEDGFPSFFIEINGEDEKYGQIEFFAKDMEELDKFIADLTEIRNEMEKDV